MKNFKLISILLFTIATKSFGANDIRIYQIYSDGGTSGAFFNQDYIVLYNNSNADFLINGWSLQSNTGGSTTTNWNKLDLDNINIKGKGFLLIAVAVNNSITGKGPNGIDLTKSPDISWPYYNSTGLSPTSGKVALVNNQTVLNVQTPLPTITVDLVGYGGSNAFETTASLAPTDAAAIVRKGDAISDGIDTDNNSSDFVRTTAFSVTNQRLINSTSLPVNLISFTGKNQGDGISLSWQTASEIGSDYFEVQKSNDFKEFITLAKINSVGSSQEINNYSFLDTDPNLGVNYYRLKQFDLNGDVKVYNAISVNFHPDDRILSVFPNPIINNQYFNIKTNKVQIEELIIYNSRGQKIEFDILENINSVSTLKLKNSNPGLIFITSSTNPNLTKKIVVNN